MTLPIIALLPLLTAWLPAVLVRRGRNACAWAAAAITAPALLLLLRLAPGVFAGEAIEADWPWIPALGLNASFRLDGLALLFALLILSFGVLVILYARYYLLQRDGVALFHVEAGSASPPLLLVHGWCCGHAYFAPQFEHFVDKQYRVVAVDLRGHGHSDKPRQNYSMQAFADDLAWLCATLGLDKPIVIGHSMGGIIAFDFACRYPDAVRVVVMLDAAVVLPAGAKAAIPKMVESLRGSG